MKAARCTASWKSTRYTGGAEAGQGQLGCGLAPLHCESRGQREGRKRLENERASPLQVAGNFHFAPGKSFQQSHVHGK